MAKTLSSASILASPRRNQVHCYGCSLIWTVPPGLAQFQCPRCRRLLAVYLNMKRVPPVKAYGIDSTKLQVFREIGNSAYASKPPAIQQPPKRSIVSVKDKKHVREIEQYEDCFVLEFDPYKPTGIASRPKLLNEKVKSDTDIVIVAEKGKVACRDYPHPRHLCATYPFEKTRHDVHCKMCYCYICDTPAPCKEWIIWKSLRHCDAVADSSIWTTLRRQKKSRYPYRGQFNRKFSHFVRFTVMFPQFSIWWNLELMYARHLD